MTHYKNDNFEKITTPNTAYIMFKHEGALPTLLRLFDECDEDEEEELDDYQHIQYKGEALKLRRALNPGNIQWENFEFTKKERKWRYVCVLISLIIGCFLYFSFATFSLQISLITKYLIRPPSVDCNALLEAYDDKELERLAIFETFDQDLAWAH